MPCSGPTGPDFLYAASSAAASSSAFGLMRDDRVDLRTVLVVRLDAIEIGVHQRARREPAGLVLGVHVFDGRVDELERLLLRLNTDSRGRHDR